MRLFCHRPEQRRGIFSQRRHCREQGEWRLWPLELIPQARLRRAKAMKLLSLDEYAFPPCFIAGAADCTKSASGRFLKLDHGPILPGKLLGTAGIRSRLYG